MQSDCALYVPVAGHLTPLALRPTLPTKRAIWVSPLQLGTKLIMATIFFRFFSWFLVVGGAASFIVPDNIAFIVPPWVSLELVVPNCFSVKDR
jgi:hypothetical protein